MEKFDPIVKQWCNVEEMIHARREYAACVLREKIYVVGGWNDNGFAEVVECYDPANDSWSIVDTQNVYGHALVAV